MTLRAPAVIIVLLMSGGCSAMRHGQPIVGGSTVPNPTGTISGTVRTSSGTPLEGRRVSAIDVSTDMHYDVTTSSTGGYTVKVPSGRYRMEVELRGGEAIATQPQAQLHVNIGDLDEQQNFVIGR